jgi:RES domain-containing protein
MQVWRICKRRYAESAFSGEGGLIAPARWHHVGNRIVYTSQSLSLATLETWVHVAPQFPLPDHVALPADIPDDLRIYDIGVQGRKCHFFTLRNLAENKSCAFNLCVQQGAFLESAVSY